MGRIDGAADVFHPLAAVEVVGPETAVDEVHVLHLHVIAVGDIDQPGAQCLQVGAFRVEASANPELLPEAEAIAVDGAGAADGEVIYAVGVYQSGKVVARLTLDAGLDKRIVLDSINALQLAASFNVQMRPFLEKQSSA